MNRSTHLGALMMLSLASVLFAAASPAGAVTLKECSALYQAAKKNGTLNGQDWRAFRASQCPAGPMDSPPDAAVGQADAVSEPASQPASQAVAAGGALPAFPTAIDPRYASEKPARARLHTCADAYHAAKKAGTLNGLRWIQKGGGFYSLCNKGLKKQA